MILGDSRILERVEKQKLIENFSKECLESTGYDLRVNRAYMLGSDSFIGVKERKTPEVVEIESNTFELNPGDYILVETLEKVNMPSDVMARILPRSSLFRCGCILATAVVDPGYTGTLTIGLKNASDKVFKLERNARVAQIVFEEVIDSVKNYNGKYQGGKVV